MLFVIEKTTLNKSYLILSYLILSYLILSYLILSYLILSYLSVALIMLDVFDTLICCFISNICSCWHKEQLAKLHTEPLSCCINLSLLVNWQKFIS